MIVVAIIGILAAIAIPAYQDYTVRAQVTEGLNLAAAAKAAVAESFLNKGIAPADRPAAGMSATRHRHAGQVRDACRRRERHDHRHLRQGRQYGDRRQGTHDRPVCHGGYERGVAVGFSAPPTATLMKGAAATVTSRRRALPAGRLPSVTDASAASLSSLNGKASRTCEGPFFFETRPQ